MKILSIPRIAISHDDDARLRPPPSDSHRTVCKTNSSHSSSSPFKSIIKSRSSQPQSPSSSTTQSYHTCRSRVDDEFLSRREKRSLTTMSRSQSNCSPIEIETKELENVSSLSTQMDTSSIYETPKHEEFNRYSDASIRLIVDTETHSQLMINDQSDMQLNFDNEIRDEVRQKRKEKRRSFSLIFF